MNIKIVSSFVLILVLLSIGLVSGAFENPVTTSYIASEEIIMDVDRDGDNDIVCGKVPSYEFYNAWFENADGYGTEWIRHYPEHAYTDDRIYNFFVEDMNGDGYDDLIFYDAVSEIYWVNITNNGTTWTLVHIGEGAPFYDVADMDQDGDFDVLSLGHHWYENDDGSGTSWTDHDADIGLADFTTIHVQCVANVTDDDEVDIVTFGYNASYGDFLTINEQVGDDWDNGYEVIDTYIEEGDLAVGDIIKESAVEDEIVTNVWAPDTNGDVYMYANLYGIYVSDYYQEYSGYDVYESIGNTDILEGSVEVLDSRWGNASFYNGTDYLVNLTDGTVLITSTGNITAENSSFPYIYFNYRYNNNETDWNKYLIVGDLYASRNGYRDSQGDFFGNTIEITDLNYDGDNDIITTSYLYDEVTWWENAIDLPTVAFSKYVFTNDLRGVGGCTIGDLNMDGYVDVLAYGQSRSQEEGESTYWSIGGGEVTINGTVYNATNCSTLSDVNITWGQYLGDILVNQTDTTDASGEYSVSGMMPDEQAYLNATATNYSTYAFSFLPYYAGGYEVNVYMVPGNSAFNGNSAVHGVVTSESFNEAVEGAIVNISNASGYNTTTTTSACGYYFFDNLSAGDYSIYSSATGFYNTTVDDITTVGGSIIIHNILMTPRIGLTVLAADANTLGTINEFNVTIDGGESYGTLNGSVTFENITIDIHEIAVTAPGYYPGSKQLYVTHSMSTTVYLVLISEAGSGVQYPPKEVTFSIKTVFGSPVSGAFVNAEPTEITGGFWDWLWELGGYSSQQAEILHNETTNATTGTDGIVSFWMVSQIQYTITVTNASAGISKELTLYPQDSHYTIFVGDIPGQQIGYWMSTAQNYSNNTGNVTFNFADYSPAVKTSWVNYTIEYLDNGTMVYAYNFTSPGATNADTSVELNASYSYRVNITLEHEDFGIVTQYGTITFIQEEGMFPIGDLEDWQVSIFGMFILFFMALMFGYVSSGTGGIAWVFVAITIWSFGWIPLISTTNAAIVFPILVILSILNKLTEQRGVVY